MFPFPLSQSDDQPTTVMKMIPTTSQKNTIVTLLPLQNLIEWMKFQAALVPCTLALSYHSFTLIVLELNVVLKTHLPSIVIRECVVSFS